MISLVDLDKIGKKEYWYMYVISYFIFSFGITSRAQSILNRTVIHYYTIHPRVAGTVCPKFVIKTINKSRCVGLIKVENFKYLIEYQNFSFILQNRDVFSIHANLWSKVMPFCLIMLLKTIFYPGTRKLL